MPFLLKDTPQKLKFEKTHFWYFDKSLLRNPDFSSTTNNLLSLLKTPKITTFQQVTCGKYTKSRFKYNALTFSKNSRLKKRFQNL